MRTHTLSAVLLGAAVALSGPASASTAQNHVAACYAVDGYVASVNASNVVQIGDIELDLFDSNNNLVFSDTGSLTGRITGGTISGPLLSHVARFAGDGFVTNDDAAVITGIRKFDAQGLPCSFFIAETISDIAIGTGFFSGVSSVNILAEGYIAFCVAKNGDTENENVFELAGEICIE